MNPEAVTSAEQFRRRSGILFLILIVWGILAAGHIFYYSWYLREKLLKESRHLAWREGVLPPVRGRILAPGAGALAWTELTHDLILPKPFPPAPRIETLIRELAALLPGLVPEKHGEFLLLKQNISPKEILIIEKYLSRHPELSVVPRMVRRIADRPGVRELVGETTAEAESPALKGISGLERKYDSELAGKAGKFRVMLDRRGNWVSGTVEIIVSPENGKDVVLPSPVEGLLKEGGVRR